MLSRRIACSLLMVFAVALTASRAEAQLGCLVDVGGALSCEPDEVPCGIPADCPTSGDTCESGVCLLSRRTPCQLCVRGPDCPPIDDNTSLGRTAGACAYLAPCGARFEIGRMGVVPSRSLCFLGPDRMTSVPWPEGDCDGDGALNRDEVSLMTAVCASVVTSRGPALERSHLVLVDTAGTGAPGLDVGEEATPVPFVGIACDETQACPNGAPRSPAKGRCVYVTDDVGVCVYSDLDPGLSQLPEEDRTCSPPPSRPLPMAYMTRFDLNAGDYDGDGIFDVDDPQVCKSLKVAQFSALSGGVLETSDAEIPDTCGAMPTTERVVLPDDVCVRSMLPTAFAVACMTRSDCPLVASMGALVDARCVAFRGSGVCVYGGGTMDDPSCLVATDFSGCGFTGADGYAAFASGNCDGGGEQNVSDVEMCSPAIVFPDTGMRADVGPSADAAEPFTDTDATVRPPPPQGVTFGGGGGCVCAAGGRKPGPGSALLALGLLGMFWARRRRFTAS